MLVGGSRTIGGASDRATIVLHWRVKHWDALKINAIGVKHRNPAPV